MVPCNHGGRVGHDGTVEHQCVPSVLLDTTGLTFLSNVYLGEKRKCVQSESWTCLMVGFLENVGAVPSTCGMGGASTAGGGGGVEGSAV